MTTATEPHCAGIAADDNNDIGVVGASTAPGLYGVKVLDSDGSGTWSDVAAGIKWAADNGIHVESLCLGGSSSTTLENACEYAYGEGTLLVAAAGNEGSHPVFSTVSYPPAYPEVIAVSATDQNDVIASFRPDFHHASMPLHRSNSTTSVEIGHVCSFLSGQWHRREPTYL